MDDFGVDRKALTWFLGQIQAGELALPDFQRDFVWKPDATRELIVSILRGFPAGSLLLLQGNSAAFAVRPFEGAPKVSGSAYLALDGQQRLTSLYQAFHGAGGHRYFLNLAKLLEVDNLTGDDIDDAVEVWAASRAKVWAKPQGQADALVLPLERALKFHHWKDEILALRPEQGEVKTALNQRLNDLHDQLVKRIEQYHFPVTILGDKTSVEAVCTIFETLNRTGVKLSAFELVTARAFAEGVSLRAMWEEARSTYGILEDFETDPYHVLQAISVKASGAAKRSAVLALPVTTIKDNWNAVVEGIAGALTMLRDECGVLVTKWLPYVTMLVPFAAVWPLVTEAKGPTIGGRRAMLKRWFWASCFSQAYNNAPNSQAESDTAALSAWLQGGEAPAVVAKFEFDPARWDEITVRQRALYQATIALVMSNGALDFHDGSKISQKAIADQKIDDHHIFPQGWQKDYDKVAAFDSVLNHTLIDKATNIRISKKAPSLYLAEMRGELPNMEAVLTSHGLPTDTAGPLWTDDFPGFLAWRRAWLAVKLSKAVGGE